jgi:uncharacterized protein (DUF2147 family)
MIPVAVLLIGAAPPPSALNGVWRNMRNTIHLRLAPCGNALCGTVVWATETSRTDARQGSGKELIGSAVLTDLVPTGPDSWRGKAYVPDIDRRAPSTVFRIKPDLLRVSGCVLAGLICRTRHWQRIG